MFVDESPAVARRLVVGCILAIGVLPGLALAQQAGPAAPPAVARSVPVATPAPVVPPSAGGAANAPQPVADIGFRVTNGTTLQDIYDAQRRLHRARIDAELAKLQSGAVGTPPPARPLAAEPAALLGVPLAAGTPGVMPAIGAVAGDTEPTIVALYGEGKSQYALLRWRERTFEVAPGGMVGPWTVVSVNGEAITLAKGSGKQRITRQLSVNR